MKRTLSLILALMLLLSVLLSGAALADELTLKVVNPDLYPVAEGAELTVWARQLASVEDFETNLETIAMEELTGVHINWVLANHSEVDTKFNLSIASGEYPDIYLNYFTPATIVSYAEDGIIIPLNDLIEENTYWLKEYMATDSRIAEQLTAPDGNMYTLWIELPLGMRGARPWQWTSCGTSRPGWSSIRKRPAGTCPRRWTSSATTCALSATTT